jgi:YidC/Oxa1 family membrane protein insertase
MEERRLLLAVALSLLVMTAYQLWVAPKPVPSPSPHAATSAAPPPASPSPSSPPSTVSRERVTPPEPVAAVVDEREARVEVVGDDVTAAFTNRGARLVSWRLLHYKDPRGRPEEMVQSVVGGPLPLDIETGDATVDERLRAALFVPSVLTLDLRTATGGPQPLRFDFGESDLAASKTFWFSRSGYLVTASVSVTRAGQAMPVKLLWGPGVGNPSAAEMAVQGYQQPHAAALLPTGSVDRLTPEKVGPVHVWPDVRWVGVEGHYFTALFVPPAAAAGGEVRTLTLPGEGEKPRLLPQAAVTLPGADARALLYVGPKDHDRLARIGHGLQRVVPVGEWIGPIVVPFMRLLSWVNGRVGSYGWSIIVLTVLINLAMAPLRHYSISNGLKMAKLSPEMRVIQERYRKVPALDPRRQEMQKEIGALYERHGMSMGTQMAVGCLPILLTMPFLIAVYRVLQVSIELRGAPFLWITDLSQKDPLFLTPVLMGISMFVMQRITPSTMDPAQQRMMMIMPVVLVVMFSGAPAGLNLYWLASNLCSIVQQSVTLKMVHAESGSATKKERKKR